jgi:peptidoglycan/LPS O-acetylase OafA/YrhL
VPEDQFIVVTINIAEINTMHPSDRIYSLEACRFSAALGVLFWHYQHFFFSGVETDALIKAFDRSGLPLYDVFTLFYERGYFAVQVFWIISGFIFFSKYAFPINAGKVGLRDFFVLRYSRLYPLHVATLLVVCGLQAAYVSLHGTTFIYDQNDPKHFMLQTLMASNWFEGQPFTFNGPIWSVSAEIVVYFAFFAMVRRIRPTLVFACICAGLSWVVLKSGLFASVSPILNCAKFFFLGGAIQLVFSRLGGRGTILTFVISLAVCLFTAGLMRTGLLGVSEKAVAVFTTCLIFVCITSEQLFGAEVFKKISPLGNLTYSSYLIHFPIQLTAVLVIDAAGLTRDVFLSPGALFLFLATVLVLGHVIFHHFELPVQNAIRAKVIRASTQPARAGEAGASGSG